mmetsp:Transcript_8682/g.16386  ORF Transcript_8682/g.16386 Transcript_8682/m.16386 type:complete len:86 (+) Transcript_8682:558-815(+)
MFVDETRFLSSVKENEEANMGSFQDEDTSSRRNSTNVLIARTDTAVIGLIVNGATIFLALSILKIVSLSKVYVLAGTTCEYYSRE